MVDRHCLNIQLTRQFSFHSILPPAKLAKDPLAGLAGMSSITFVGNKVMTKENKASTGPSSAPSFEKILAELDNYQLDAGITKGDFSFNEEQLNELREEAISIVKGINLERLSWDDAWSGCYPEEPSDEDVNAEFEALKVKAYRILSGNAYISEEYSNWTEHRRMMALEFCETFNIWK
ncbi:hypothetical protein [Methylophaga sp. OBS1]|uniref:hypothetical protein n=1 Tax=Methylophaga sp. OBS1 TaxID=2991933 RepID=UPI00224FBAC3|nr:hypothetical protein [Methylophaga sp. OBS1]MCX4192580.1 hypothetical protein [Methylophaga sp. OBS1]